MRKVFLVLGLLLVGFLSVGASAVPADAAVYPAASGGITDDTYDRGEEGFTDSGYLPIQRWGNMQLHNRVNWFEPVIAVSQTSNRALASAGLGGGTGLWQIADQWVRSATNFNILQSSFAYQVDNLVGIIGQTMQENPLIIAVIIIMLFVVVFWRSMRHKGQRPIGRLIQAAVVFTLIIVMGAAAHASTAGGMPADGKYKAAAGTPVWFANVLTGTLDTTASSFVEPVMFSMRSISDATSQTDSRAWSCSSLANSGIELAKNESRSRGGAIRPGTLAVSNVMNSMWYSVTSVAYSSIQFGGNNPYADYVWCHQLERQSDESSGSKTLMLYHSLTGKFIPAGTGGVAYDTEVTRIANEMGLSTSRPIVLNSVGDNETNDSAMVFWAACRTTSASPSSASDWTVAPGWVDKKDAAREAAAGGGTWITPTACQKAWAYDGDAAGFKDIDGGDSENAFNIDGKWEDADAKTNNEGVRNFLYTLHASTTYDATGALWGGVVYFIGALIATAIFGLLALIIFGAKIVMLLLLAASFVVLVLALFRIQPVGETVSGPSRRLMGVTIFAFMASLLLAIIGVFSLVLAEAGKAFGLGPLGYIAWVSAAPVFAVVGVHYIFTRVLKQPSPVTPRGAMAWGLAGGAAGAAVGSGLMNRMQSGAKRLGRDARDGAASRALDHKGLRGLMSERQRSLAKARGAGSAAERDETKGASGALGEAREGKEPTPKSAQEVIDQALTKKERKAVEREAKAEWREGHSRGGLFGKQSDRMEAFRNAVTNGELEGLREGSTVELAAGDYLKKSARERLGKTNLDNFLLEPGQEGGSEWENAQAGWSDLNIHGKLAAVESLVNQRRNKKAERVAAEREERAAAGIPEPTLRERALQFGKTATHAAVGRENIGRNVKLTAATAAVSTVAGPLAIPVVAGGAAAGAAARKRISAAQESRAARKDFVRDSLVAASKERLPSTSTETPGDAPTKTKED